MRHLNDRETLVDLPRDLASPSLHAIVQVLVWTGGLQYVYRRTSGHLAADAQFNTSNVICPPNLEKKTHRRRDTLDAWNNLLLNEDLNENIQTAFGFLDKDAIFRADPVAEYISIFSSPAGPSNLIRPTESKYLIREGLGGL
eukprot:gene11321-18595_t